MQVHLGSLALGGVLVAGGFLLGSGALPMRQAQAGVAVAEQTWTGVITSSDEAPGAIWIWERSGSNVMGVTMHRVADDVLVSRRFEPPKK